MENHDKCACKCLIAYYKEKGYALGTKFHEFYVEKNKTFHVEIDQYVGRSIKISAKSDTPLDDLYDILDKTEKILMLFEGRFIHLNNIVFSDSDTADDETLNQYAQETLKNRLNYFSSADFCKGSSSNLIDYKTVLTTEMYKEWEALLDELNSSYQVFLYAICDNKMTIDINCAFLIELAEPFIELLDIKRNHRKRGRRTLKEYLKILTKKHGSVIFKKELQEIPQTRLEEFYDSLVNTRHSVMHTKMNKISPYLNGDQSLLYIRKLILLYRVILFDLLGINNDLYIDNLNKLTTHINNMKSDKDSTLSILEELIYNLNK